MLVCNPAGIRLFLAFLGGFSPYISQRTRKRGPGSERDWRLVQSSRYRASLSCSAAADTAPMSFSALSTCSSSRATTCDGGCSRSGSECWQACCAGSATVSPSMRSVAASSRRRQAAQTNSQFVSAGSKLPKQRALLIWRCCSKASLTRGLASRCCCRFLLLRSSEGKHLPAYSVCNGPGNFPRGCRELSGRTGKFFGPACQLLRVAPRQLASGMNSSRRAQIYRGQRPFGEKA
jgi:hypothetical protein